MATYIFTDFDRLSVWQVELAAQVYRQLKIAGANVLNDPARVLHRLPLLKTLYREGVNAFQVWDCACDPLPDQYPVFLRTRAAHRGVLTDLLQTPEAAEDAREKALADGYCIQDLMFVEYCAEPVEEGVFYKASAFRIGDTIQIALGVHDRGWAAKYGEEGLASEARYKAELDKIQHNLECETLRRAFELSNIEYGRVDFAVVNGVIQIYEVNTNPHIDLFDEHSSPAREKSQGLFIERISEALRSADLQTGERSQIALDHPILSGQRNRDWLIGRARWTI